MQEAVQAKLQRAIEVCEQVDKPKGIIVPDPLSADEINAQIQQAIAHYKTTTKELLAIVDNIHAEQRRAIKNARIQGYHHLDGVKPRAALENGTSGGAHGGAVGGDANIASTSGGARAAAAPAPAPQTPARKRPVCYVIEEGHDTESDVRTPKQQRKNGNGDESAHVQSSEVKQAVRTVAQEISKRLKESGAVTAPLTINAEHDYARELKQFDALDACFRLTAGEDRPWVELRLTVDGRTIIKEPRVIVQALGLNDNLCKPVQTKEGKSLSPNDVFLINGVPFGAVREHKVLNAKVRAANRIVKAEVGNGQENNDSNTPSASAA